jgi:hypothetical protein
LSSLKKLLKAHRDGGGLFVTPRYEQYLAMHPNILVDETIARFVASELTTPQRDRTMSFSASSRGFCPRKQVFGFTTLEAVPKTNTSLYAIFHQGTFMHLKWQALLLDAGILDEVEVFVEWPEFRIKGSLDGVGLIPEDHKLHSDPRFGGKYGWELKSINSRGYSWVCDTGPKKEHLLQIHAYMLASGLRVWSLCYENKDTQEWREFIVHYDEEIADEVTLELAYLNEMVDRRELPPVLGECKKRQGQFKSCEFAHACLEQVNWPARRIKLG